MKEKINFDPRTKMFMVLTITTIMLSSGDKGYMLWVKIILAAFPFGLMLYSGSIKKAFFYFVSYTMTIWAGGILANLTTGFIHFILVAVCGFVTRFMPGFMAGYYLVATTKVSEFMAAMDRIHLSKKVSIPMSVMFRFFPTVGEEYKCINDAMKMRGIVLGGKQPQKILEYKLVPLLASCVKIGDELSAAALTRGFGAPVKRTNICKIGFHLQDASVLFVCILSLLCFLVYKVELIHVV